MLSFPANDFDLKGTLFCGQSFSWEALPDSDAFIGIAGDRAVIAKMKDERLVLEKPDASPFTETDHVFWYHYFAMDENYTQITADFSRDSTLGACVAHSPGIRVLRQPFFDTLLSFIISQNNHIPRISGIVKRLRESFGRELFPNVYSFPSAERLAELTVDDLAPLRAGFRGKYLLDAACKVASGQINEALALPLDNDAARRLLMQIHGVGPKVADCVLLFALGRCDVIPMDVWMKRALLDLFPAGMPAEAKGREGIAQQYIFVYARAHL